MPIEPILKSCKNLRILALAAHDCHAAVLNLLSIELKSFLICSHIDFSALDAELIAKGLESNQVHMLPSLTLYDPSALKERYDRLLDHPAWDKLKSRGTQVIVTPDPRILGCLVPKGTTALTSLT